MDVQTISIGLLIPLAGTSIGAATVLFARKGMSDTVTRILAGFAGGVMIAAGVWSLLIPAMEQSTDMGQLAFVPAVVGFWLGTLVLLALDRLIPHLHVGDDEAEGMPSKLRKTTLMVLAITLHNIPEGMAVGVVFASLVMGGSSSGITVAGAMALAVGIAIQNVPEGAIISLPLRAQGQSRTKAFLSGVASGIVEPIGAAITIAASSLVVPILPYLLSFAAGAMTYVVVEELIPQTTHGRHSNVGALSFAAGFTLMMALDVALG